MEEEMVKRVCGGGGLGVHASMEGYTLQTSQRVGHSIQRSERRCSALYLTCAGHHDAGPGVVRLDVVLQVAARDGSNVLLGA